MNNPTDRASFARIQVAWMRRLVSMLCVLPVVCFGAAAQAQSPFGEWRRPATGVIVKVFRCGGGVGVKVVKSSVPERIGKVYMCGARSSGAGAFSGRLTNPEDNGTYSGHARLISAGRLRLSGCMPGTVFCRSEVWHKVK